MKALILSVLIGSVFLTGCKGERGEQGPAGTAGTPGAPAPAPDVNTDLFVADGVVLSNDFTVFIPVDDSMAVLSVYIGSGGALFELPYFLPGEGVNTFYMATLGQVRIFNAKLAGATYYKITVIRVTAAASEVPAYKRLF